MVSNREVIEEIQKDKFGIGLTTDLQSQKVIEELKSSLNRALEQLSEDLYSKETHFVLELIQNADDNHYEKGAIPFLKFVIDPNKIYVQNNETGFTEDNVRALADVGRTTKNKIMGYIGEKGIGFKSVFRISNEPQIFSNRFRFKFKHKEEVDKLGFIIPYWIEEIPEFVDETLTNIVLPLREEIKSELSKLNEIEPALLLFLHKLKIIEIHNKIENTINRVIRHDQNKIVEIEHSKGEEYWKLIRQNVKVPQDIQEERRKNIKETELILGFPLNPDGSSDTSSEQKVFAYLPTRSYGFKFIIHADFLLPANREDIHKDKLWNKWLRDSVVIAFLQAIDEFKKDEKLGVTYYSYIPLENEVTDEFFLPVVGQISAKLKEIECVLTESKRWLKPTDVFNADEEIRELISNQALQFILGKEFISSEIKPKLKREVLRTLGIKTFEFSHLLLCLNKTEWLREQSDEWFVKLYSYLNSLKLEEKQLKELMGLKIIRLENGESTSISEGTIFLQLDKKGDYGFEKEIRVIKRSLIEKQEKETKESVLDFLKKLGVRNPSPYGIIENHILPIYENKEKSSNWESKRGKILLGYVRYIKDNLKNYEEESDKQLNGNKKSWEAKEDPLGRMKTSLLIRTNKLVDNINYYAQPRNIYLPRAYGNENDLEKLFKGIEGVLFLNREYIDEIIQEYRQLKRKSRKSKPNVKRKRDVEVKEWKEFFVRLGVNDGLLVEGTRESYLTSEDKQRLRGSYWNYRQETITDYILKPLKQILDQINEKYQSWEKANLLTALFERDWKSLSNFAELKYEWKYHRSWYSRSVDSTWVNLLRTNQWVPTTKGIFAKPSEVFTDKPEIRELLGDSVPYLAFNLKNEGLIRTLGITAEANAQVILIHLKRLVEQKCQTKLIFTKLYPFLNKHFEGNEEIIRQAFSENSLIFLTDTAQNYFRIQEVLWKYTGDVLGDKRGYLEKHYPKLKSFFVEKLGVNEKPLSKDYANFLIDLSKKEHIDKKEEKIIFKIYEELNDLLKYEFDISSISVTDWWQAFLKEAIYWTDREEFWFNEGDVFVNDNQELYDSFKNNLQIAFLKLPGNNYTKFKTFIDAIGVPYLSKVVEIKLIVAEEPKIEESLTNEIQRFVPYILRYLYYKMNSVYERLKKEGTLNKLEKLEVYSVSALQVEYKLGGISTASKRSTLLNNGKLYIQSDKLGGTDYLAVEISKLFGETGIEDFLISLFEKKSEEKIENLMKAKEIQGLPIEELEWFGKAMSIQAETEEVLNEKEGSEAEAKSEVKHEETIHSDIKKDTGKREEIKSGIPANAQTAETPYEVQIMKKDDWQCEVKAEEAEIHVEELTKSEERKKDIKDRTDGFLPKTSEKEDIVQEILSEDAKKAIGRWGEEYALKYLREMFIQKYSKGRVEETLNGFTIQFDVQKIVEVQWLNKMSDKGVGHDIKVIEGENEIYIEVKSTKTDNKDWFPISRGQWELAQEKGDNFHIYRIYNAGTLRSKLIDIPNPIKLWLEGGLIAYPIRIQI